MLSQHERQQLDDIERRFEASDPDLARVLRDGSVHAVGRRRVAAIAAEVLGGLLILLGALASAHPGLILTGIVVGVVGGCLHASGGGA